MHNCLSITSNFHKRCYSRVLSKTFWISLPEAEIQVIKVSLCCDIWLNFALVAVQRCAVCMELYRDSVIALLHNANFQAASHCCRKNLAPNIHPSKPDLRLKTNLLQASQFLKFRNCPGRSRDIRKRYIMLRP